MRTCTGGAFIRVTPHPRPRPRPRPRPQSTTPPRWYTFVRGLFCRRLCNRLHVCGRLSNSAHQSLPCHCIPQSTSVHGTILAATANGNTCFPRISTSRTITGVETTVRPRIYFGSGSDPYTPCPNRKRKHPRAPKQTPPDCLRPVHLRRTQSQCKSGG